jgi:hypothetical protein
MRRYQNTLLAGAAALAFFAATGLASAQAPNGGSPVGQEHATQSKGGSSGMRAQGQGQSRQTAQSPNSGMQRGGNGPGAQQAQGQGKAGPTAQRENRQSQQNARANQHPGQDAQQGNGANNRQAERANRGNTSERGVARNGQRMEHGRQSTAQRERTMRGLQGNASGQMQGNRGAQGTAQAGGANGRVRGSNVRLSDQQQTRIRETIIGARNAPRVGHVNFSVNVGTAIPREQFTSIHVVPVPEYLVRIEPRWRGLEYFIFEDEIVVVNPRDLRIVAIIPV